MKLELTQNKDVLAGLLFIGLGAFAFHVSLNYDFGTTLDMGPGYFPRVLSLLLVALGVAIMVQGLRHGGKMDSGFTWVPLALLTLSLVLFGFAIERLGLVPALALLLVVAAYAGREFRIKEVFVLTVLMCAFAVVVFIWGLKLPYPLFSWSF